MTTLPALPPTTVPTGAGLGVPTGSGSGAAEGGAFAGLLAPGAPPAQPAPGAPALATVAGQPPATPEGEPATEAPAEGAAPVTVGLSAAQIIAAAQLTPVGPMLANAPRLTPPPAEPVPVTTGPAPSYAGAVPAPGPSYAGAVPAPGSPTESSVPATGTALLVGKLGQAAEQAPAGPAVEGLPPQGTVTEGAPVEDRPAESQGVEAREPAGPSDARSGQDPASTGGDTGSQSGSHTGASATSGTGAEPATPGTNQSGQPGGQPAGTQAAGTQAAGTQPTAAQTSAVAGLTGTGPTTATAAGPGDTAAANPVAGQVFPEVTRLVSRGDGTRRITLQLSPEALGDVRVVLTVRNGEVQVRMSGGELAQQALLAGAPELHRLLDQAGATGSQIQVGSQSSTTVLDHQLDQSPDQHTQQRTPDGELQDHQNHRTAGTRDGDTSARDGAPRGTHPHPATNPGTRTRITGVDVTM